MYVLPVDTGLEAGARFAQSQRPLLALVQSVGAVGCCAEDEHAPRIAPSRAKLRIFRAEVWG